MDKSLKVLGAKISGTQKSCDERLKKIMDEQQDIKNKLAQLTKKESDYYLQKDFGDIVYEKKMNKQFFVNTYGSEIMVSVLVVVNKKKVDQFKKDYMVVLQNFNQTDYDNWQKRTRELCKQQHQNVEDESQKQAMIDASFEQLRKEHEKQMDLPGVVPNSEAILTDKEDPDGNQLWRVTAMKDQVSDYIRVMKKNGYPCQEFHYDSEAYNENRTLEAQLKVDLTTINNRIMQTTNFNFQELFSALLHLKIMRTYIDGVLRFGIPPRFFMGILKPAGNKQEVKIMGKLTEVFAEEHLKEMYG